MIARLDHRPRLTALLALTTAVLVVVVIALATLLLTAAPAVSPTTASGGGNLGAPANMGAGAASQGYYDIYSHSMVGHSQASDSAQRQEVGHP